MAIRNIVEAGPTNVIPGVPVKGTTRIWQGEIVQKDNVTGYCEPGSVATGKTGMGQAVKTVDNLSGADGDLGVDIIHGGHSLEFDNSSGADAVLITDIGSDVYINGANSVSRLSAGKSKLGKCVGFSPSGGVRVYVNPT